MFPRAARAGLAPLVFGENPVQINLSPLVNLIEEVPAFRELSGQIKKYQGGSRVLVLDAAKPFLIAALYHHLHVPVLVITAQPENATRLYEQIAIWTDSHELDIFPEPDTLPYQRTIADFAIEQERLQVLSSLINLDKKKGLPLLICSAPALVQKTTARSEFASACHIIKNGSEIDPMELMRKWQEIGYQVENLVEVPGTISRRGDIIDIYPPTSDAPVRLEFFGNTLESIRLYDSATQRSQKVIQSISICPANEILPLNNNTALKKKLEELDLSHCSEEAKSQYIQEIQQILEGQRPPNLSFYSPVFNNGNLLDYLPAGTLIIRDEMNQLKEEIRYLDEHNAELRKEKVEAGELPPNFQDPHFTWDGIKGKLDNVMYIDLLAWEGSQEEHILKMEFTPAPSYAGQLPILIQKSKDFLKRNQRLIYISNQAARLSELLEEDDILAPVLSELKSSPLPGTITLLQGSLETGWLMGNTHLLTDKEIFGFIKERRFLKKRPVKRHKLLVDIKPGDYIVHVEHGIGQFTGIQNMNAADAQKEYLVLTYAAGDKLYVPTDQIDRVSRYVGSGEDAPTLSRLGTQEWNRTKQKVKDDVEEIAQDLLELYAKREVVEGHVYPPDTVWQKELEASFPYVETPDQLKVQDEVKEDMTRSKPMDRLIVGDVGYGKTEIALRAAFKAVMDNKQVAVLVPTTVLAEQHYLTFQQRMGTFPVKIDVLSRFRSPKELKGVIAGLANGSVDICIGTHRILQKDVIFKDLGLLIIDEEQRFGVSHKEFLKKLREQVDVLTLSATPIPRTLHMSLVGVRDMSIIETPPENRQPIRTYVAEYSDHLVREAILRELERNGQVFFVHNRVQGIAAIADRLQQIVPEAKIDIGHGQMPEDKLEKVMFNFQRGDFNVLVCTTIIESGLDMPNVNTLIVNKADRFGLTQLYQLRGRIGRGSNLAYSYFLYDRDKRLTPLAEKRLRTIYEATELGAGFGIAMKDLEIRGAGNLLGMKQSGNISAVGFNLYTQLLAEAVEDQKAIRSGHRVLPVRRRPPPSIDLPLKAYIPESYVAEVDMRLSLYQRITEFDVVEAAEDMAKELTDRFGPLPIEAANLLYIVKVKALGAKAGVESIGTNDDLITIRLFAGLQFKRENLVKYYRYNLKLGTTQIIASLKRLGKDWQKALEEILKSAAL
jgi:transcription-repair coupling factor (superfamily II helicase)